MTDESEQTSSDHLEVGRKGEEIAVKYLRAQGYRILDRNHETGAGELDVIAHCPEADLFVFVEVRTRANSDFPAEESIGYRKRKRVKAAGKRFLSDRRGLGLPHRFDVIGVSLEEGEDPLVRHYVNAF